MPSSRLLTEADPQDGAVMILDLPITEAVRWCEGGQHFIRSTEFDVFGQGATLDEAVDEAAAAVIDLWRVLLHMEDERITDHEREVFQTLNDRIVRIASRFDDLNYQKVPLIKVNWPRRQSGQRAPKRWEPRSRPRNFSQPSPA